jgi:hypothetical protein
VLGVAVAVVLAAVVAATFAPWYRSGAVDRSSYEVVRSAVRLGVLGEGAQPAVARLWAFVPLGAAGALLALARGRRRAAGALAALVGLSIGALAVVVLRVPGAAWGASFALVAAAGLVIAAAAVTFVDLEVGP